MAIRRGKINARLAHVGEPDFFSAPQFKTPGRVLQFAFAGLHPKKMRAGFFKTLVLVRFVQPPRADRK